MKSYAETIISPKELKFYKKLSKKITIEQEKNILIRGRILDSKYNPVEGVIIVIKKIYCNYTPHKITEVGYVITNIHGEYVINIEKINDVNYKLEIYEPMIKNKKEGMLE